MNAHEETTITGDSYLAKCIEEIRAMREVFEESHAAYSDKGLKDSIQWARELLQESGLHPDLLDL